MISSSGEMGGGAGRLESLITYFQNHVIGLHIEGINPYYGNMDYFFRKGVWNGPISDFVELFRVKSVRRKYRVLVS